MDEDGGGDRGDDRGGDRDRVDKVGSEENGAGASTNGAGDLGDDRADKVGILEENGASASGSGASGDRDRDGGQVRKVMLKSADRPFLKSVLDYFTERDRLEEAMKTEKEEVDKTLSKLMAESEEEIKRLSELKDMSKEEARELDKRLSELREESALKMNKAREEGERRLSKLKEQIEKEVEEYRTAEEAKAEEIMSQISDAVTEKSVRYFAEVRSNLDLFEQTVTRQLRARTRWSFPYRAQGMPLLAMMAPPPTPRTETVTSTSSSQGSSGSGPSTQESGSGPSTESSGSGPESSQGTTQRPLKTKASEDEDPLAGTPSKKRLKQNGGVSPTSDSDSEAEDDPVDDPEEVLEEVVEEVLDDDRDREEDPVPPKSGSDTKTKTRTRASLRIAERNGGNGNGNGNENETPGVLEESLEDQKEGLRRSGRSRRPPRRILHDYDSDENDENENGGSSAASTSASVKSTGSSASTSAKVVPKVSVSANTKVMVSPPSNSTAVGVVGGVVGGGARRHCAFCRAFLPTEALMVCSLCKRRAYCSRNCQSFDWPSNGIGHGHEKWCGLEVGEEDLDFKVIDDLVEGSKGMVALRALPPFYRILVMGLPVPKGQQGALQGPGPASGSMAVPRGLGQGQGGLQGPVSVGQILQGAGSPGQLGGLQGLGSASGSMSRGLTGPGSVGQILLGGGQGPGAGSRGHWDKCVRGPDAVPNHFLQNATFFQTEKELILYAEKGIELGEEIVLSSSLTTPTAYVDEKRKRKGPEYLGQRINFLEKVLHPKDPKLTALQKEFEQLTN